ncbi:substrate-binding periplasmic protein [Arsukibacterium indicum]|uniref:Transporter substrate-binding domain-containing protein n=1 Tax=Arsukibacterium indicum TaxID=2848612 RepID=A0ABS6MFM7_9GAMM|nr:transporter substrate-binding domain-containing protein [Arsukibacterium indicum]MBV2127614.1 transporter substrate-binding domain-containing protein [Arsukibacterium indicum]
MKFSISHSLASCGILLLALSASAEQQPLRLLTEHKPPGTFLNEKGHVSGATVELVRHLQQQLNEPGKIELLPWARAYEMAKTGPDVAVFETIRNAEREALFKWVGPLKQYKVVLYARADRLTRDLTEFPKYRIACEYRRSALVDDLVRLGFSTERNLVLTSKHGDCYDMLLHGRIYAIALSSNNVEAQKALFLEKGVPLVAVLPVTEVKMYMAFSPDVSDTRVARWQAALEQSYLNGTMRKLYQNVYPEQMIAELEALAAIHPAE